MKKVFLFCAALLFAGGAMAQNESKWRELARRDYEQCLAKFDSLQRVWPQMSDEDRRAALSALRMGLGERRGGEEGEIWGGAGAFKKKKKKGREGRGWEEKRKAWWSGGMGGDALW